LAVNKNTHFGGTPIIKQILKFITLSDISRVAKIYNSARYYKKFKTYDYFVGIINRFIVVFLSDSNEFLYKNSLFLKFKLLLIGRSF